MKRRVPEEAHRPFERSPRQWRAMRAPRAMWDDGEALRVAREVYPPGWRLDGFGSQGERLMVRRLRRAIAATVLDRCGQLTAAEREKIARHPSWYHVDETPQHWLWSVDDVLADSVGVSR